MPERRREMKKIAIVAAMLALLGFAGMSHASDWDLVGKVLTGVEGARILTGGRVDIIGSVMDISGIGCGRQDGGIMRRGKTIVVEKPVPCNRIWVPEYRYKDVWVPGHYVRDPRHGRIYIKGHCVQRRTECGGHWEYVSGCGRDVCSGRARRR